MKFSAKQINASHLFVSIKLDVICYCVSLSLVATANENFSQDRHIGILFDHEEYNIFLSFHESVQYESTMLFGLSASKSHLWENNFVQLCSVICCYKILSISIKEIQRICAVLFLKLRRISKSAGAEGKSGAATVSCKDDYNSRKVYLETHILFSRFHILSSLFF